MNKMLRITAATLLFLQVACSSAEPVKIGLIADLSGVTADLGISGRDGAMLAVEQANRAGGIQGRSIKLTIHDNRHDILHCKKALADLEAEKVIAIIGPMTSSMAMVVVPFVNTNNIPAISPTVSTEKLAGLDDNFFRTIPVSTQAAEKAAEYLYSRRGYRKICVIYDLSNAAYTVPWYEKLKKDFEFFEGATVQALSYASTPGFDFLGLLSSIKKDEYDCLVVLANALDTALISQQRTKLGVNTPLFASEWSATQDLLEFGGAAVEGLELFHSFNHNDKSPDYRRFFNDFQNRFGYAAGFASAYAYDAMQIIITALKNDGKGRGRSLKNNILTGSPYTGVQHEIKFNTFGDVERDYTLLKVQNGRIITP